MGISLTTAHVKYVDKIPPRFKGVSGKHMLISFAEFLDTYGELGLCSPIRELVNDMVWVKVKILVKMHK